MGIYYPAYGGACPEHICVSIKGNHMKLDRLIEGYQRLCECKNGSSITSDFRVISIPKYCIFNLSKAYISEKKSIVQEP